MLVTFLISTLRQVDGNYAAVRFPSKDSEYLNNKEDLTSLMQDCRLLRKDELIILKSSGLPKVPDCFQKQPKKLNITDNEQVMAVAVDNNGGCRSNYFFVHN